MILSAQALTKEFRGFFAVRSFDFEIRRHSVHALIGPNGAGKTTVFNLLTKVLHPTGGTITFNGRDITALPPAQIARLGMVRSFQISAVFPQMTVLDNVCVALQRPAGLATKWLRPRSVLGSLHERAHELLASVQLGDFAKRAAAELSYGRKRALEIATTLALEPELLLLDEPMAGMGHEDVAHTVALIREVARDRTVLMVEHNLAAVSELCDHITVLARGERLAEGTYAEVSSDPEVRRAYLGSAAHV